MRTNLVLLFSAVIGLLAGTSPVLAVDGVVLIDQNRALAGNVTPGDTPGFPVTISLPGSYRLSGNLTSPDVNTTAILVTADNVAIDLNGFGIIGPAVCVGTPVTSCSPSNVTGGSGVDSSGRNTTVVNGSVRGMGNRGIIMRNPGSYVEKVHAESNGGGGISLLNSGTAIGNTVIGNGFAGIEAVFGGGNAVSGNRSIGNQSYGITVGCPSVVIGNVALSNGFNLNPSGVGCALANNAAP